MVRSTHFLVMRSLAQWGQLTSWWWGQLPSLYWSDHLSVPFHAPYKIPHNFQILPRRWITPSRTRTSWSGSWRTPTTTSKVSGPSITIHHNRVSDIVSRPPLAASCKCDAGFHKFGVPIVDQMLYVAGHLRNSPLVLLRHPRALQRRPAEPEGFLAHQLLRQRALRRRRRRAGAARRPRRGARHGQGCSRSLKMCSKIMIFDIY